MLWELQAEIPAAAADAADEALLESGDRRWSVREDAVVRRAWVVGLFDDEASARAGWLPLRARLEALGAGKPSGRPLADADWADSYKAHFHPWHFGRLHWAPVWERGRLSLPAGEPVLWLDPGLAFGTGNHETTRLGVERLVALAAAPAGRSVIDAGCGSGILALSAALLGFGPVAGFDCDPTAVRVSRENAALNGLERRVSFFAADLPAGLAGRRADVVLANIQADVLIRHAGELAAAVAPGGSLVLGGILASERDQVRSAFAARLPAGPGRSRTRGEWCDLVYVNRSGNVRPRKSSM